MSTDNVRQAWGEIISRCWKDETFKQEFIAEPAKVMQAAGLAVKEQMTYQVLENTDTYTYVALPAEASNEVMQELVKQLLVKAEAGTPLLPEGSQLRLVQNTDTVTYIVLPAAPVQAGQALTAADLDQVAGGTGDSIIIVSSLENISQNSVVVTNVQGPSDLPIQCVTVTALVL